MEDEDDVGRIAAARAMPPLDEAMAAGPDKESGFEEVVVGKLPTARGVKLAV